MIAIRTPLLVRSCLNSGLSIVKKNHELQQVDCTNMCTTSAGRYQENKDTCFKTKIVTGAFSWTGTSHEERRVEKIDSGASMHMMCKSDLIHEETMWKSKSSVRLLQQLDQSQRQKKPLSASEMWRCQFQLKYWKIHQLYFRSENYAKGMGIPTNAREDNHLHQSPMAKSSIASRKIVYQCRTWSYCRQILEAMHWETECRQLLETESKIFQTG